MLVSDKDNAIDNVLKEYAAVKTYSSMGLGFLGPTFQLRQAIYPLCFLHTKAVTYGLS